MSEKEITPQENPDIQLSSCYYFEILKADNVLKLSEQGFFGLNDLLGLRIRQGFSGSYLSKSLGIGNVVTRNGLFSETGNACLL